MNRKILTICSLNDKLLLKYHDYLEYRPLSNDESDESWEHLIKHYRPLVILFGLQTIDDKKLSFWRKLQPADQLKLVRKGTSLHRVDFAAAKKYAVDLLNTAGANAPFVAQFILELLLAENKKKGPIAVLGVGNIGSIVVSQLLEAGKQLLLFNRSLHSFEERDYIYSSDLLNIFERADQIAICLPLNQETIGMITEKHIRAVPENGQILCVSPPRILSREAVSALHERRDLHVTFDHVASGLTFIYEALGHQQLRPDFIFEEKAAAGDECQYAMGEAAILKALDKNK